MTETTGASIPASEAGQEDLFPIREVCRLTGINPVTLWRKMKEYGI